ncbi:Nucleolar Complex 2 protein, partial [Ascosphaera acerosa]
MAGSAKKATKKFEKKHLKDTIDRRREFAKVKQRHQQQEKKRSRREAAEQKDKEKAAAGQDGRAGEKKQGGGRPAVDEKEDKFANMNVDDFFAGGFDLPSSTKTAGT